ncbi:MAG: hypothetical protein O3A46_04525, partial [Candidatus Poribacteria bacterium]|nr:hypothetical protein [Candidatus Poribacteria bacterium]
MRWRDRTIIGMSVAGLCVGLLIGGCSKSEKPLTAQTPMALELMSADENAPGIEEALERGIDDTFEQVVVGPQDDGTYIVATTQRIDPAGESVAFPGRPTDLALSPDGATIAVKNQNNLVFIATTTNEIAQTLAMPSGGNSWEGVVWSADGATVWTTDVRGQFRGATRKGEGAFEWATDIEIPTMAEGDRRSSAPGGFFVDESAGIAYVTASRNNAIAVLNLKTNAVTASIPVGIAPYTIIRNGDKAYVSNWGGRVPQEGETTGPTSGSRLLVDEETGVPNSGTVSVIDLKTNVVSSEIEVGLHPSGMALSPDGSRLYVANANSDAVSVIDTVADEVVSSLNPKPMRDLPFGSAPNALAVSPDGDTLYVANGGNNVVAVIDLESEWVVGLIPTGWYPGAVVLSNDGGTLYVANTKGVGSRDKRRESGYNSHDYLGTVNIIPAPDAATLEAYTLRSAANMRLPKMHDEMSVKPTVERVVPVPTAPGETSPIKHVLYIIKENRTYDQVFGDIPQGNGDPELCIFGEEVTPNLHALVNQYVLLDNFYCNGTLSADGHQWTNEGYVTDYLEKSYGGWPRSYPYEGDDALAFASSGFIWDQVLKAGLTFR